MRRLRVVALVGCGFFPSFPSVTFTSGTPIFSVGVNQTARIHAVSVGEYEDPCTVEMWFLDEAGNVLSQATKVLSTGASASLTLDSSPAPGSTLPFRAWFRVLNEEGRVVLPSLEVIDNETLKTGWVAMPGTNVW
jgi:hypothetical protein